MFNFPFSRPKTNRLARIVFKQSYLNAKREPWPVPSGSKIKFIKKTGFVKVSTPDTDVCNNKIAYFNMSDISYIEEVEISANIEPTRITGF